MVTQVDSQVSANDGILIQVLGEMCNHNGPSQKFSQTFFLATQPNGYYVLNDIFRFLKDEVEIDYYACEQQQQVPEPVVNTPVVNPVTAPVIEAPVPVPSPAPAPAVAAAVTAPAVAQPQPQVPSAPASKPEIKKEEKKKPVAEEEVVKKEEEPVVVEVKKTEPVQKEPETEEKKKTKSEKQQQKAEPKQHQKQQHQHHQQVEKTAAPVKPSAPKTWANLAAVEKSPVVSHATTTVNATPVPFAAPVVATNAPNSTEKQPSHNQQRQQHQNKNQNARGGKIYTCVYIYNNSCHDIIDVTSIFVKGVNDQINEEQLLEAFNKIGSIKSSNISRPRSCAFIEFNSPESCQKALAQHKVQVGSHVVLAEERRYNNQNSQNQNNQRYNNQNQNRSSQSFDQRRSNSNSNNQNRRNNQNQQNQGGSSNRQANQTGKGRGAPTVK